MPTGRPERTGVITISKSHYQKKDPSKNLRTNERIRISPIRLIDENNEQVGIVETRDAIDRARNAGLDLVEVAPQSAPPVCRIMDYGKWKYEQNKKERKSKAARHEVELKEVRIKTPKIGEHDLLIKVNHAREFLERGDRVQFSLRFRGRELAHIDEGIKVFESIKEQLADIAKVEQDCRREGRRIAMLLSSTAPAKPKPKDESKGKDRGGDSGEMAAALKEALGDQAAPDAGDASAAPAPAENDGESNE